MFECTFYLSGESAQKEKGKPPSCAEDFIASSHSFMTLKGSEQNYSEGNAYVLSKCTLLEMFCYVHCAPYQKFIQAVKTPGKFIAVKARHTVMFSIV